MVTVITDLITAHLSWRDAAVDRVVVPSEEMAARCAKDGAGPTATCRSACRSPPSSASRRSARPSGRSSSGSSASSGEFLVVLTGGAEGSGGLRRRAAAILRQVDDVDVAVICGRNRLAQAAGRPGWPCGRATGG